MLLGAAVACRYALLHAPCLRITRIIVNGCNRLTPAEVARCAGIGHGQNMLAFSIREATAGIERNPWVSRAVVKRILPDTVSISIEERRALARIALDRIYLLDGTGDIFSAAGADDEPVPLLRGITNADIAAPDPACGRAMQAALQLIGCLKTRQHLRPDGMTITVDKVCGLTLHEATTDTAVFLGFDDFEDKLSLLRMVHDDLARKKLCAAAVYFHSKEQASVTVRDSERTETPNRKDAHA